MESATTKPTTTTAAAESRRTLDVAVVIAGN
jgi:hypothetical protein